MTSQAYLPHRPPALLITEVLESSPEGARCLAQVPAESPFVQAGRFPAFLALEMGAQGAAAGEAKHRSQAEGAGEAQAGFVVRITRASFPEPLLDQASTFEVITSLKAAAPPLRTWTCRVLDGERLVAEAEISTFAG